MWHLIDWNPCGTFLPSSRVLNATLTFFIPLTMESAQRVDPVHHAMPRASSTNFGRHWPYLCVLFKYFTFQPFTSKMVASLFLRTQYTHQLTPGSKATSIRITNSATLTGWYSLRSDSFSQEVESSFHLQQKNQPLVDLNWQVVLLAVISAVGLVSGQHCCT